MTTDVSSSRSAEKNERVTIALLCLLAAVRVFVFSAAFPFFNNVDEQVHFDLVMKYSTGHVPGALEPVSKEAIRYIVLFGSSEYLWKPDHFPGGQYPLPPWKEPLEKIRETIFSKEAWWSKVINYEGAEPPLYYCIAAVWLRAGQTLSFEGAHLLYWLRFLNIFFIVALVWIGYGAARLLFPDHKWMRLGVPLLLAALPQDCFYGIENDPPFFICFGVLFICLIRWWNAQAPDAKLGATLGLSVAATYLSKGTALPLLFVAFMLILMKGLRCMRAGETRNIFPALGAMTFCALLPIAAWVAWIKSHFGDITGSSAKIAFLGWTHKPLPAWFHHPIFTPHGFWTFVSDLLAGLWRGEIMWHGVTLASPVADKIYAVSSLIFIALALAAVIRNASDSAMLQRQAVSLGLLCVAASMLFLATLSISFDFGDCYNPSRYYPYFTAGRLLGGPLVPFAILYVYGLTYGLKLLRAEKCVPWVLGAVALLATISEIVLTQPVFASLFNWFHL